MPHKRGPLDPVWFFFSNIKQAMLASLSVFIKDASVALRHFHKTLIPFRFRIFPLPLLPLPQYVDAAVRFAFFLPYCGSTLLRYHTSPLRYGTLIPFAHLCSSSNTMSVWGFYQRTKHPQWFMFTFHMFWGMGFPFRNFCLVID